MGYLLLMISIVVGAGLYAGASLLYADWQKRERARLADMAKAVKR